MRRLIGCAGGRLVGALLAVLCRMLHPRRARPLSAFERAVMEPFFPDVDLGGVRIVERAHLPIAPGMRAMTLGDRIYVRGAALDARALRDMGLLMHELVHVGQVARAGSIGAFMCRYGSGWVERMSYAANPIEQEARAFERANAGELHQKIADFA